jgi:hypothetical protein
MSNGPRPDIELASRLPSWARRCMSMRQPLGELSRVPASRSDHGVVLNAVEDRIRLGLPAAGEALVWKRTLTSPQR